LRSGAARLEERPAKAGLEESPLKGRVEGRSKATFSEHLVARDYFEK